MVWVAERAGEAVIGTMVALGIQWMKRRFQSTPHKKSMYIFSYEDDAGHVIRVVEMSSPDEEPDIREPHEFEAYTNIPKPPEKPDRKVSPWWRRVFGGR